MCECERKTHTHIIHCWRASTELIIINHSCSTIYTSIDFYQPHSHACNTYITNTIVHLLRSNFVCGSDDDSSSVYCVCCHCCSLFYYLFFITWAFTFIELIFYYWRPHVTITQSHNTQTITVDSVNDATNQCEIE